MMSEPPKSRRATKYKNADLKITSGLTAKTPKQQDLINALKSSQQVFILGPAGCKSGDTIIHYRRGKRNSSRSLTLKEFVGKFNGEKGYSGRDLQEGLPTVTVLSANGANANVEVLAIQGDGEELETVFGNNKPGQIQTISIIDAGESLVVNPTLDLSDYGDGTAIAEAVLVPSFEVLDGRWTNSDGKLSANDIRLPGLNYYIDFSYVISSSIEFSKYKQLLKDLLSPSGSLPYGRLERLDVIDSTSLMVESETTLGPT
jgi:hypothetical protein